MFKEIWLNSKSYALWIWLIQSLESSVPGRIILGWLYGLDNRNRLTGKSRLLVFFENFLGRISDWIRGSRVFLLFYKFIDYLEANPHPFGTFLILATFTLMVLAFNAQLKLVALVSTAGLLALAGITLIIRPKLGLVIIPLFGLVDFLFRSFDPLGPLAKSWDDVILGALLLGIFLHSFRSKEGLEKEKTVLGNPLVLPFAFFALSTLLAVVVNKLSLGTGLSGVRVFLQSMLFFIPGWYLVKDKRDLSKVIQLMLIGATLVALYGIWQYWVGLQTPEGWIQKTVEKDITTRVFSVLGNPNGLGGFLILFLPLSFSLYFAAKGIWAKVYYAVISGVMLLALGYTYSRGAWIGVAAGIFFLAFLRDKRLAVPVVAGALAAPILKPSIINRFTVLFSPEYMEASERFGRIFVWSKSVELITRFPIFGIGPGMFKYYVYNKFGWVAYAAENYFLQIGVEAGLLGLFAFLWFLLTFFKYSLAILKGTWGNKAEDPFTRAVIIGAMGGTVAVAVHNLTTNIWGVLIVSVLNWFLLGAVLATGRFSRDQ